MDLSGITAAAGCKRPALYIKKLRNEVNIADVAVIIGSSGGYIEIWNPQSWEEEGAIAQADLPAASL